MHIVLLVVMLNLASYSSAAGGAVTQAENNTGKSLLSNYQNGSLVVHTPALKFNQYITNSRGRDCEALTSELNELKADLDDMKKTLEGTSTSLNTTNTKLEAMEAIYRESGSTFVRWGRKNCTENSQLVYSGSTGGSHYSHTGAAANALCLTPSPQWDGTAAKSKYTSMLYGAEYEEITGHHNHDVPCSVCHAPQSMTIMVPATLTCPSGWISQYSGHLTAGYYSHQAASQYLCLDGQPEHMFGGHEDKNGRLLYYTVAQCGSLRCPPFIQNRVITCVVCSK